MYLINVWKISLHFDIRGYISWPKKLPWLEVQSLPLSLSCFMTGERNNAILWLVVSVNRFSQIMEKKLLKRIEEMEDGERDKLRELLKDSKQPYVLLPSLDA